MKALIQDIWTESTSVKRFFLEVQSEEPFRFTPGQFITISHETEGQIVERSYSIASEPGTGNSIELCVVFNENGLLTPELWKMKPGDSLSFRGPLGGFMLREPIETDLCFVCTGTGVAPFRSMIRYILHQKIAHRHIWLIFGARTQDDLLYRNEFNSLSADFPEFHYVPVLSREKWNGESGYVHQVYQRLFDDGRDARFYVCGWQNMCSDARNNLKNLGYNRRQYFFEQYDG